jgi:transposase
MQAGANQDVALNRCDAEERSFSYFRGALGSAKKIKRVAPLALRSTTTGSGKRSRGRPPKDHRLMVEGMIYILRTSVPWRDLPEIYGPWSSVYTRWYRWAQLGIWEAILKVVAQSATGVLRAVDATFLKVHQHGANPVGGQEAHAIGRTKGGLNTKLHAVVDGRGRVITFMLTAGQVHELKVAPTLLATFKDVIIIGDKAYDSDQLHELLSKQGCRVCISSKANRRNPLPFNRGWYRKRHRVENFFGRAKQWRRFATRYDKTLPCFLATASLVAVLDWLN